MHAHAHKNESTVYLWSKVVCVCVFCAFLAGMRFMRLVACMRFVAGMRFVA